MGFMDSVAAFTKGVGQKAKGNYDVMTINSQISTIEREIGNVYREIGLQYFTAHKDEADNEYATFIQDIIAKQAKIDELKKQAEETKAATDAVSLVPPTQQQATPAKFCTKCGAPMEANAAFCTKCGAKAEEAPAANAEPQNAGDAIEIVEAPEVVEETVEAAETVAEVAEEVVEAAAEAEEKATEE